MGTCASIPGRSPLSRLRIVGVVLVMLVAGCINYRLERAEVPPIDARSSPPPEVGQICVLRHGWALHVWTALVRDEGRLVGATRGTAGHFCWYAEPGRHRVSSLLLCDWGEVPESAISIEVKAGGRYFLAQNAANSGKNVTLTRIGERFASELLEDSEYEVLTALPGTRAPSAVQLAPTRASSPIMRLECANVHDGTLAPWPLFRACFPKR